MSALFLLLQENQKWYERYPYCLYNIFEPEMPIFLRWLKPHQVFTYKSTVLELCEKYPDSEIGIYQINGEYIRAAILHKSYKEEFLSKYSLKEEPNKNLLLC